MVITYTDMMPENVATTIRRLQEYGYQDVEVHFSDTRGYCDKEKAQVYLLFWSKLAKYGVPVDSELTLKDELFTENSISKILSTGVLVRLLEAKAIPLSSCLYEVYDALDNLSAFIRDNCVAYISTLSMLDIIDIYNMPTFKQIKEDMKSITETTLTDVVEEKIKVATGKMMEALGSDENPSVDMRTAVQLGLFKPGSLAQMLLMCGPRTDVDDTIITRPVTSCYMDGLKDIKDYVIDTLTAKKAAFYLNEAVAKSEYFSRKQHLPMLATKYAYPGDCGSKITIPFFVNENYVNALLGNNYVDDRGNVVRLTKENIQPLIGTTIELKNPLGCRHRNGICAVCGGDLSKYSLPNVNEGIKRCTQFLMDTSQEVISNKHMQFTNTKMYTLDPMLRDTLVVKGTAVVAKRGAYETVNNWRLGISISDAKYINNLCQSKTVVEKINLAHFSSIRSLIISDMRTEEDTNQLIPMSNKNVNPHLSADMLRYIQDNPDKMLIKNDFIWIDLSKFNAKECSLFSVVTVNDSVIAFSQRVEEFLQQTIITYTNAAECLRDFSDIVYERASHINISHLGAMLKTYMVSGGYDYSIPIIEDINNVKFGNTVTINKYRSWGQMLAFQNLTDVIFKPETYCVPKSSSCFDTYFD